MMPGQSREFLNSKTKTNALRNKTDCQLIERKKRDQLWSLSAETDNSPSLLREIKVTQQVFALEEDRKPSFLADTHM